MGAVYTEALIKGFEILFFKDEVNRLATFKKTKN